MSIVTLDVNDRILPMVKLRTAGVYDYLNFNFGLIFERSSTGVLTHPTEQIYDQTFPDQLTTRWSYTRDHELKFYGRDFVTDDEPWLASGRIETIEITDGYRHWISGLLDFRPMLYVSGLSLDAATLRQVSASETRADDYTLMARIFSGNDRLELSAESDRANGYSGNDILLGGGGNDFLQGGNGNDLLSGGRGDDRIALDAGNDRLIGGTGRDCLHVSDPNGGRVDLSTTAAQWTGQGYDYISGFENLRGAGGGDHLRGNDLRNDINGMAGNDLLAGGAGFDTLHGLYGDDRLLGEDGNDKLWGGDGFDSLNGGAGDDQLYGGWEADILFGGTGFDYLHGESGNDTLFGSTTGPAHTLTGGTGADVFRFIQIRSGDLAICDTIRDFQPGQDRIDLRAIDADPRDTDNDAFTLVSGNLLPAAPGGQVAYYRTEIASVPLTFLLIDTDGDAEAEMMLKMIEHHSLSAADFIL